MTAVKGRKLADDEVKGVLVDILDRMDEVLRREKIAYFLYYGTLLGAVRHKGIIPWDDDVDIVMFRADYDKLARLDWSASGLDFVSHHTRRDYPYLCGKITDRRTVLQQGYDHPIDIGLYVDIFPLDEMPSSGVGRWTSERLLDLLKIAQAIKMIRPRRTRSTAKNTVLMLGKLILRPVSTGTVVRMCHRLASRPASGSSQIASRLGPYGEREIMDRACFSETEPLDFEGRHFLAPVGWKHILTSLYRDYMTPPPPEKRVSTHAMEAFLRDPASSGEGRTGSPASAAQGTLDLPPDPT